MLQAGGEQLEREIHKLCNKAWQEGTIPDEWGQIHPNTNTEEGRSKRMCKLPDDLSDKSHGKSTASRATQQ
ncbi:unnamed protein product, partial [Rotaria magnacalcarata]